MSLKFLFGCASLLAFGALCSGVQAQSVPVGFAGTLAGGGTACATAIPEYAVGKTGASFGDGCPAAQSVINTPVAATTDSLGNVFISDQGEDLIRVVYNGGTALANAIVAANVQTTGLIPQKGYIYTLVGGVTTAPTNAKFYCNGTSGAAGLNIDLVGCPGVETYIQPRGVATDADGNVFFANVGGPSVVTVFYVGGAKAAALITLENPSITAPIPGYTYNVAGTTVANYSGDGTLATKAGINTPRGIFIDANENVYFADQLNQVVRRVDSGTGFISTIAGHCVGTTTCTATASSGDGSVANSSTVNIDNPYGVVLDQSGNIFIAEGGGGTTTIPGRVRVVYEGGTLPGITSPTVGNIYTYAGAASGTAGISPAQAAVFQYIYGVSLDPAGYLYATEYRFGSTGANHVYRIDPISGAIATIAGNGGSALTAGAYCNGGSTGPKATDTRGDGCPATQAYLNLPQESFAWSPSGTFYIADRGNNTIRSFTIDNLFPATAVGSNVTQPLAFLFTAGSVPTTETFTNQGVASTDYSDAGGDTCALNATLALTTTCVEYVKFAPAAAGVRPGSINIAGATGTIGTQTLVGTGLGPVLAIDPGTTGALGSNLSATSVSTDEFGNVYVSDAASKSVLKGTTTLSAFTQLTDTPGQTVTDPYGNLFVADPGSNKIIEVVSAAKGGGTTSFGTGLSGPQGVAADQLGNVYIADTGNNRLVCLSPATGNIVPFPVSGFTLNAPTGLATDSVGDLFVVDSGNSRILEVPMGGNATALTLPSGTVPTGITIDAAGDLYITDKTTASVLYFPVGTTTSTGLVTGLKTPIAVAVSPTGAVYVADSLATSIITDNRAVNTSSFLTTNVQLTSLPVTLTVDNIGNTTATLATPPFVETGSAAAFPAVSTSTTCVAAGTIAIGGNCTQSFVFQPTTPGLQSAKVVFSTTTGQTAAANFSATATNLIFTNTTLTLTNTGTVSYGQTATYTVTLTTQSMGSAAPTGMINILVNGTKVASATVPGSLYSFPLALPVGTDTVSAVYTGDAIYAGSNTSTMLTVTKSQTTTTVTSTQTASGIVLTTVVKPMYIGALAPTGTVTFYVDGVAGTPISVGTGTVSTTLLLTDGSHTYYAVYSGDGNYATSQSSPQTLVISRTPTALSLTVTTNSANGVTSFLLSAKLMATGTGTPTGTVTFYSGTTAVGTLNLSTAVNGVATFTLASATNYTFSATYSGDGLFQPSSATATPTFFVVAPTAGITVLAGGQNVATITVNAIEGYTGTLTGSCTNLPTDTICRFTNPSPVTVGATGSGTTQLEVFTGVAPNVAAAETPRLHRSVETVLAVMLLSPLAFAFRRRRATLPGLLAIAFMMTLSALSGCGNKTPAYSTGFFVTPVGTYTPTVVMTDSNGVSNSSTFTLTVLPPVSH